MRIFLSRDSERRLQHSINVDAPSLLSLSQKETGFAESCILFFRRTPTATSALQGNRRGSWLAELRTMICCVCRRPRRSRVKGRTTGVGRESSRRRRDKVGRYKVVGGEKETIMLAPMFLPPSRSCVFGSGGETRKSRHGSSWPPHHLRGCLTLSNSVAT